jgi:hypothetical protein
MVTPEYDDDKMVITSNKNHKREQPPATMAATAHKLFGNPMPQYLNAITIATNQAIADTGATYIFIMDGVEVENKRLTKKPLIINLPDGRKVKSTHECDINIPGLPCTLTGHIVPTLAAASLIGIRPSCKTGCKVIFDNKKCEVVYKVKVIFRRFKDTSTDLWMLPIPTKGMQTTPGHVAKGTNYILPQPGPCKGRAPHPPTEATEVASKVVNLATFTHSVKTRANKVKFAHQLLCNPKILTLLKAVQKGFLKGCPNFTKKLILKYLNPSPATAKGHMKRPKHGIKSTHPKPPKESGITKIPVISYPPQVEQLEVPKVLIKEQPRPVHATNLPNLIRANGDESFANVFCFGAFSDKNSGIIYHNLMGSFPFMSYDGSVCFFILYHYESNAILGTPSAGLDNISIFEAYKKQCCCLRGGSRTRRIIP